MQKEEIEVNKLVRKTIEEDREEATRCKTKAAAKEISLDVALAAVSLELNSVLALKEEQKIALKAFLWCETVFLLYSQMASVSIGSKEFRYNNAVRSG